MFLIISEGRFLCFATFETIFSKLALLLLHELETDYIGLISYFSIINYIVKICLIFLDILYDVTMEPHKLN